VQFATYRRLTGWLTALPSTPPPPHVVNFVAGGLAGATATTATYPLDLLRTRLAAAYHSSPHSLTEPAQWRRSGRGLGSGGAGSRSGTGGGGGGMTGRQRPLARAWAALLAEHRAAPFRPFFRGLPAALASIVPYMGLFFVAYEALKRAWAVGVGVEPRDSNGEERTQNTWLRILGAPDAVAGTVASVVSKTAVFPLDTVRKRLQVQGQNEMAVGRFPVHEGGVARTLKEIVAREGVRGLYRGLGIGLAKAAPAGAVTIWAYERSMVLIRKIEQLEEEVIQRR
jgi:solute carrier family 25 (mitochondrial thiamine pyrophosphate transporter), member 19